LAPPNSCEQAVTRAVSARTAAYTPNSTGLSSRERMAVDNKKKSALPQRSTPAKKIERCSRSISFAPGSPGDGSTEDAAAGPTDRDHSLASPREHRGSWRAVAEVIEADRSTPGSNRARRRLEDLDDAQAGQTARYRAGPAANTIDEM